MVSGSRRKSIHLVQLLESRIRRGDYSLRELPTELQLADEVGVSRSTARHAFKQLIQMGLIERPWHGRLLVKQRVVSDRPPQLAMLTPAFNSIEFEKWRAAVVREAAAAGATARAIDYVHWDDPSVSYALTGFDGVFLVPSSDPLPPYIRDRFTKARNVIVLGADFTSCGLRSIQLLPAVHVHRLGDHLLALGHRRIDCLNTQPRNEIIRGRMEQWSFWKELHGVPGETIDAPVESYVHPTPQAYEQMQTRLKAGRFTASALLCITDAAATGAARALHEAGVVVGRDVAVCAVEGGHLAQFQTPSRTCLLEPAAEPYIRACVSAIIDDEQPWTGPTLIQPANVELFVGESSCHSPVTRASI